MEFKDSVYWQELSGECAHADEVNRDNLLTILRDNNDTAFGKVKDFASIKDVDEYRRRLPISGYEPFRTYVCAMLMGEKDQLTVYPIYNFCHTSGTEGLSKFIPVTSEALRRYDIAFTHRQDEAIKQFGGKRLFFNTFRTDLHKESSKKLLFSEAYYRYMCENNRMKEDEYLGGFDTMFSEDLGDRLFVKLWLGFACADITVFESIFMYDALIFFTYLKEHWHKVYDAMEAHSIPADEDIPDNIRKILLSMPYTDERLADVKKLCESGMHGIAQKLWPNLKLISGVSNKSFFAEDQCLREYIGDSDSIEYYYLTYGASECYMTTAHEDNNFSYLILPKSAFFEFRPFDDEELNGSEFDTVLPKDLKVGAEYSPVITTFSGLYRYIIEDVLVCRGFIGESPLLEFVMRKSQTLNIAGEKVDIRLVEKEIASLSGSNSVMEWTIGVELDLAPGRYFVTAVSKTGNVGVSEELADILDSGLSRTNPDYADLRQMNYISKPLVLLLPPGAYGRFLKENGLASGHKKPNHISVTGFSTEVCRKWVEEYENK